jgi:hypothetical protein
VNRDTVFGLNNFSFGIKSKRNNQNEEQKESDHHRTPPSVENFIEGTTPD